MKTEAEFMAEFDRAHKEYMELRAAKGFPFNTPDKNKPLPSWVLRYGERPKLTFVTKPYTGAVPAAKSVQKPTVAVTPVAATVIKPEAGQSFASQVRAVIADVKPKGWTQEQVVEHAVSVLNMKRTSAINCVKHNWERAK
jgi:hypothetical protein